MPSSDFTPTVDDVGAMLRGRTRDDDGNELGTFTPTTLPTDTQAQSIIEQAVEEIAGQIGENIPARLRKSAKSITTLLAAMNVELTYYAEQVNSGKSAYEAYERRVNAALGTPQKRGWLVVAVNDEETGGDEGSADDAGEPMFYFGDGVADGEITYDPETQRWIAREPDPSASEGAITRVWQ